MLLYHFSEEENIEYFEPRIINNQKEQIPLVWAIDEEHSINYYFPRECPRIIYYKDQDIMEKDDIKFFGNTVSKKIITLENNWIERINNTILYKYTFKEESFELNNAVAGYYVSKKTVKPIKIEKMNNLLDEIIKKDIEVRITPNLYPLRDAIIKSGIRNYSIIRFRNAKELKQTKGT
jgi:hypothetical protein